MKDTRLFRSHLRGALFIGLILTAVTLMGCGGAPMGAGKATLSGLVGWDRGRRLLGERARPCAVRAIGREGSHFMRGTIAPVVAEPAWECQELCVSGRRSGSTLTALSPGWA